MSRATLAIGNGPSIPINLPDNFDDVPLEPGHTRFGFAAGRVVEVVRDEAGAVSRISVEAGSERFDISAALPDSCREGDKVWLTYTVIGS